MGLVRRLGAFDITLITVGGIIGAGIFRNPAVVAQRASTPGLILAAWIVGGLIALVGAFTYAELGARRPETGGTYAYLRDAFHPVVAFMFGWTTLVIAETGGNAASAILFAGYLEPATGFHADPRLVSVSAIALVTIINCLGVRQGGTWQNVLVALKLGAIGALIAAGFFAHPLGSALNAATPFATSGAAFGAFGVALIPVLYAYTGFQTTNYVAGETHDPQRALPIGLIVGTGIVAVAYVLVNVVMLRVLGAGGLAASQTPGSDVMQAALGNVGTRLVAIAIAVSTLGFISTKTLLTPRVFFQMADDGAFFKQVAWIDPKTHVPVVAIVLQGIFGAFLALTGTFERIVDWSVTIEYSFVALAAVALFVFRKQDAGSGRNVSFRSPGHPYTTALLIVALAAIAVTELIHYPVDTLLGAGVTAFGAVVYLFWHRGVRGQTAS